MTEQTNFGWVLLILGLVIAGIGLIWLLVPSIPWLGRLPGDIRIETEHSRFYFPLTTCLLLSLILTHDQTRDIRHVPLCPFPANERTLWTADAAPERD